MEPNSVKPAPHAASVASAVAAPAVPFDPVAARPVLLAVMFGVIATGFPFTILTVALNLIADDFGVSEALSAWTVSAPMLLSAATLPLMGKIGDMYGHRRVFLWDLLGSSVFAGLCVFAWDIWSLIILRVITMILAGATGPSALAMLFQIYPPEHRAQAVGWWSMSGPGSAALGLAIGGPVVDFLGWPSVFFVQAIMGVAAWFFAVRLLPETPKRPAHFDHIGNALLIISLSCLLFLIGSLAETSVSSGLRLTLAVVGFGGLAAFFYSERHSASPMVPLSFFQQRNFTAPITVNFLIQAPYTGALVATPIVFMTYLDFSVTFAALFILLRTASLTVASPFGGRIATLYGERAGALLGTGLQAVGLLLVGVGAVWASIPILALALLLQGIGHGIALPPMTSIIATAVPPSDFGTASGVSRLSGQIGSSFGLSVFGVLLSAGNGDFDPFAIFALGAGITLLALIPAALVVSRAKARGA